MKNIAIRLLYVIMIPTVVVGCIILIIPHLLWWIFTGGDLMGSFVDFLNNITPDIPQ